MSISDLVGKSAREICADILDIVTGQPGYHAGLRQEAAYQASPEGIAAAQKRQHMQALERGYATQYDGFFRAFADDMATERAGPPNVAWAERRLQRQYARSGGYKHEFGLQTPEQEIAFWKVFDYHLEKAADGVRAVYAAQNRSDAFVRGKK